MKGISAGAGFTALHYNGKPILMDEKCTSGALIAVREEDLDWYALPYKLAKPVAYKSQIDGNDYGAPMGLGFSWSDWIIHANAGGVVGHIYFGGQFITKNPKRHGKLTGITSI